MKFYADKFRMAPEQSLFLAKKKWDENVYCGMRMENRNITFPQTKTILQGVNVPNVQLDDAGIYECRAENSRGKNTFRGQLQVYSKCSQQS